MRKNTIQIILAITFLVIFFLVLFLVLTKKIDSLDQFIYDKISKIINPTNTKIMKFLTLFGSTVGIGIGIIVICFILKNNFDRGFFAIGMLAEVALNNVIKVIIKRNRPIINPLVMETGYSFPSGHTMSSTAFFLLIIFFLWKSPLPRKVKIILTIPCCLIILCVLFSRVYLGVHYFSDVIAGFACSVTYVLLLTYFYTDLKHFIL